MKSVEKISTGGEILATYNSRSSVHNFFVNWGIHCSGYSMGPYPVHFNSLQECTNFRVWKRYQLVLPSSRQIMIIMNEELPLHEIDLTYFLLVFGTLNEGQWPESKGMKNFTFLMWTGKTEQMNK